MRYLPFAVMLGLWIYCWIEIAQSDPAQVRRLPRVAWAFIVVVPIVGALCWLFLGRPNGSKAVAASPRLRPKVIAPDDDPDFLRSLRKPPPEDEERRTG